MTTAPTIGKDMKDRIGEACFDITIEQLIKVHQAFQ